MNVQQLVDAVGAQTGKDSLASRLSADQWKALAPYLTVRFLRTGEPLMRAGECDRELFILADGELLVMVDNQPIATLQPGTVVGEATFFSGEPRSATVTPSRAGVAWSLSLERFEDLARKNPSLAVELLQGLGAVLAVRMREAVLVGQFI